MRIQIMTDSASDLDLKKAQDLGITVLPMIVTIDGKDYEDGVDLSPLQFYDKLLESDGLPHTSQITPYRYEEAFEKALDKADEVIYISLSSALSGSCSAARLAAREFDGKVLVVDSENVCIGQQILVLYARQLLEKGLKADEIVAELEEVKKDVRLLALLDTLEYLKKGGRISGAAAMAGELFSIKPVISIIDGKVELIGKARGSRNGGNFLRRQIERSGLDFDRPFLLAYSGYDDSGLKKYIKDSKSLYEGKMEPDNLEICQVGSTIGTHAGPGAIAIAFFAKKED